MNPLGKPYVRSVRMKTDAAPLRYPYDIPAVRALDGMTFHPDVTFFVGENGSGKSTVLEALAMGLGFSAEGGTMNVRFQTTESAVSSLHDTLSFVRGASRPKSGYFLRAESFYNVATYMEKEAPDFQYTYGGSLHERSHGESFMALLTVKLRGNGLYLFDEPEAALSPSRQLAALSAIHQLVKQESQFIIATHSPILLSYPNARILQFSADGIEEVRYEETEHFAITRDFLNNYPRRLEQLLDGE
jgi:predicted ATPase